MSADLFAAFEDVSEPPPSKGHPPTAPVQASLFTSDPFSFGTSNSTDTSTDIGQPANPVTQRWSSGPTSWGGQLGNTQHPSSTSSWTGVPLQPVQSKVEAEDDDDDDGWGDFEVAQNANQPPAAPVTSTSLSGPTTKEPRNPALLRTRVVRASTLDLVTNNLLNLDSSSSVQNVPKQVETPTPNIALSKASKRTPDPNPNVLFDADDFDGEQHEADGDDDDFGEFETVASPVQATGDLLSTDFNSPPKTPKSRPSQMLSNLNLTEPASYPQAPRSPSFQERNPFPGLAVAPPPKAEKQTASRPITSPVTVWPSLEAQKSADSDGFGDDWDAFDNLPDEETKPSAKADSNWDWDSIESARPAQPTRATQASLVASGPKDSSWDWDPVDVKTEKQAAEPKEDLPPTNVPPPSILLSVFPQLFDQANTSLYKPISGQNFSVKNRILSDPKTIEFLKGYLALATVVARIIAGRKLRWHRDKFLAQRMSISAAGSKGMKLAGVDKAQAAREDREAADVVASWKEQVGRLRSAVAAANSSIKNSAEQLRIPEISESMQIQTEKMVPTAPKPCVVCGLKRNERIPKVDYEVEDSFGEWWVDHWGHLACKRFWLRHENALRQR